MLTRTDKSPKDAQLQKLYQTGDYARLIRAANRLPPAHLKSASVQTLIGAAEMALSRPKRAAQAFRKAISAAPTKPAPHSNLGLALRADGKREEARTAFQRALALNKDYGDAINGLGLLAQDEKDMAGAEQAFRCAAELKPKDPEIWTNLGNALQQKGALPEACEAYRTALALAPHHPNANYNYGAALRAMGDLTAAIKHYQLAIRGNPNFSRAYNNLGNALRAIGDLRGAEAALRQASKLAPKEAEVHQNLGGVLQSMGRFDDAAAAYDRAVDINPDNAAARASALFLRAQMCDWRQGPAPQDLGLTGAAVGPYDLLALDDDPVRQRQRAERYAAQTFGPGGAAPAPAAVARPKRLRLGYFSADFRDHPVARLIAGTIAAHDRDRFDVLGYSFGPDKQDGFRREFSTSFDTFREIRALPDDQAAAIAAQDALDIAVDLTVYTQHSRTALFDRRLAPVHINYLGYPGTSGAPFLDYIIADPVVVPPEYRDGISEAVIALPHCYQPNDNRRPVPHDTASRAAHGLPQDGIVLCSFNSAFKISPREFDIWMRILGTEPGTVLWLLESTPWARSNLTGEAEARGIDPARLVFAPRVGNEAHLARHHHADLFLDTFAYNAHTTGSDALWMGLPVVTLAGRQFAARVCASLLQAVNLPELITQTEADYADLILSLIRTPDRLVSLRDRLQATRNTAPLFDTERHTSALESAYDAAHQRWRDGTGPADISIDPV
ncbi:MAG: tetratricopeptide repeat protein [Pseudomonadota bacterium]